MNTILPSIFFQEFFRRQTQAALTIKNEETLFPLVWHFLDVFHKKGHSTPL